MPSALRGFDGQLSMPQDRLTTAFKDHALKHSTTRYDYLLNLSFERLNAVNKARIQFLLQQQ